MTDTVARDATERNGRGNQRDQTLLNLTASAEGGTKGAQMALAPDTVHTPSPKDDAVRSTEALRNAPLCYTCQVRIKVAVFFDGTGNNLDADLPTNEHSNVARLFRSHPPDNPTTGIYRLYVPGLGTYFKQIGDPGDDDGMAFGKRGEPRLQWAMQQIDKHVAAHPVANIIGIDVALFGFSRGAALARAFARRIAGRCKAAGAKWLWDKGGFEASINFMGLFDTVASVGLPASTSVGSLRIAKKYVSLDGGLKSRRHDPSNGLEPISDSINLGIAFGVEPGADPTPGFIDGHGAWAGNLRVPPMVLKCLHFTSAHEMRNSFPLDSARDGNSYPSNVDERWYPGVHSNVGGGYRPGEGGRSLEVDEMLSLPSLLSMHDAALDAGVPLAAKNDPRSGRDFEVSEALLKSYNNYIQFSERNSPQKHLEGRMLANRRLYFAWRFKRIHERSGGVRPDASIIAGEERRYVSERAALEKDIASATNDPARQEADRDIKSAQAEYDSARASHFAMSRRDWVDQAKIVESLARMNRAEGRLAQAKEAFTEADDARLKLEARKATLGGSGLVDLMNVYDKNLLLDVEAIQNVRKAFPRARLRPHYVNLLEAYDAEFVRRKGLLDDQPDVLAFFDRYVHDSLAGFAKDETLPSDPRVIYLGGDREARYAERSVGKKSMVV